jgi:hypothetical protein
VIGAILAVSHDRVIPAHRSRNWDGSFGIAPALTDIIGRIETQNVIGKKQNPFSV